jgi:S1-C subfamily serine protease
MTPPRGERRGWRRLGACVAAIAVVAGACAGSGGVDSDPTTTPPTPTGIPDDLGLSDESVARVLASTVGISGVACGRLANGSGFAITADLVVTNAHVLLGLDEVRVATFDGRELIGIPVAFDPDADLAILEVRGAGLEPLPLAVETADGTAGMLVGWESGPFADPTPFRIERPVTVRIETVGGTDRVERRAWVLAAEIDRGDSGAALVNAAGEVVGVVFAASREEPGVGYAVRVSEVDVLIGRGLDPNLTIPGC